MKRTTMIRICLNDACNGELHPLMGLIDWLVVDKGISLERIVRIANRKFGIPVTTAIATLDFFS